MATSATPLSKPAASTNLQRAIRVALALASLVAYAVLTLNLQPPPGSHSYGIEREPMAVAVSNLIYGARLGREFAGVRALLVTDSPVEDTLDLAAERRIETGELFEHALDGMGFGYPLFVTAAMRAFGIHTLALVAGFLCLEGLAAVVFLLRFHDDRALLVPLYFLALSAIQATPIGTDSFIISQVAVGGYRYFSLLAVIPALHIALELIDNGASPRLPRRIGPLAVQALVLTCAYAINASVIYVTVPILLIVSAIAILRRRERRRVLLVLKEAGAVIAVALVAYGIYYSVVLNAYKQSGYVGDLFWHRIFISYGANPAWPFGTLNDVYSACKRGIPRGLVAGIVDQNGHCVWNAYVLDRGLSSGYANSQLYSSEYERALRSAFFKVLVAYPRESIATFLYYKPIMIIHALRALVRLDPEMGLLREIVLIGQAFLLVGFAFLGFACWPARRLAVMAGTIALVGAGTFGLYLAAWSTVLTSSDLVCYLFMLIGLAAVAVIAAVHAAGNSVRFRVRQDERRNGTSGERFQPVHD
jgi:hypothetical protein